MKNVQMKMEMNENLINKKAEGLFAKHGISHKDCVFFIKREHLGDIVRSLPAITLYRHYYPEDKNKKFVVLTSKNNAGLMDMNPDINETFVFSPQELRLLEDYLKKKPTKVFGDGHSMKKNKLMLQGFANWICKGCRFILYMKNESFDSYKGALSFNNENYIYNDDTEDIFKILDGFLIYFAQNQDMTSFKDEADLDIIEKNILKLLTYYFEEKQSSDEGAINKQQLFEKADMNIKKDKAQRGMSEQIID